MVTKGRNDVIVIIVTRLPITRVSPILGGRLKRVLSPGEIGYGSPQTMKRLTKISVSEGIRKYEKLG